jgi:CubicO group peptidase (beta-lactamase class C family)
VILRDTTILAASGFGLADVEQGVPVTPATPFNIASVAKPIAGVIALRLVEQGVLDLDRPSRLPGFTTAPMCAGGRHLLRGLRAGSKLTLHHVLS